LFISQNEIVGETVKSKVVYRTIKELTFSTSPAASAASTLSTSSSSVDINLSKLGFDKHDEKIDGRNVLLEGVATGLGDKEEDGPAEVGVSGLPPLVGGGFFYIFEY
jgi:hypothetical protein